MSESTLGTEHLLPFERKAGDSPASAAESLEAVLASDPDFGDEASTDATEQQEPEAEAQAEAEGEPEAEESADGDESEGEDEPEDAEEPDAPSVYRVKVDGQEVEVPLDELLKGYSRTADYTRKTTEVANQRKALDSEAVAIREAREQYAARIAVLEKAITDSQPKEPDWDTLRKENPAEYAALKAEHQERKEALAVLASENARVQAEREAEYARHMQEAIRAEAEKLVQAIPAWKDDAVAAAEKKALVEYATKTYGWTPDDLGNVTDHRIVRVMLKAMKYDELQTTGKDRIREKAKAAPVLKPGAPKAPSAKGPKSEMQKKINRLRQTGRALDAASILEDLL